MGALRCSRIWIAAAGMLAVLAPPAFAQRVAELPAGARVQLEFRGWDAQLVGTVMRATPDSIAVRAEGSDSTRAYATAALRQVRLSTGDRPGHVARQTTWGLGLGVIMGATLGALYANDSTTGDQVRMALTFGSIFAIPGVLLGAHHGNRTREGWRQIELR